MAENDAHTIALKKLAGEWKEPEPQSLVTDPYKALCGITGDYKPRAIVVCVGEEEAQKMIAWMWGEYPEVTRIAKGEFRLRLEDEIIVRPS